MMKSCEIFLKGELESFRTRYPRLCLSSARRGACVDPSAGGALRVPQGKQAAPYSHLRQAPSKNRKADPSPRKKRGDSGWQVWTGALRTQDVNTARRVLAWAWLV